VKCSEGVDLNLHTNSTLIQCECVRREERTLRNWKNRYSAPLSAPKEPEENLNFENGEPPE